MRIRRRQTTDHSDRRTATSPETSDVSFFSLGPDDFAIIPVAGDPAPCLAALSEAETRVLAELATGRSNREIAISRGTSLRTITNQVSAVFRKLGVRSRSELVLLLSGAKPRKREH
jgi:DNA-binding NarL/FixJ family response regulator